MHRHGLATSAVMVGGLLLIVGGTVGAYVAVPLTELQFNPQTIALGPAILYCLATVFCAQLAIAMLCFALLRLQRDRRAALGFFSNALLASCLTSVSLRYALLAVYGGGYTESSFAASLAPLFLTYLGSILWITCLVYVYSTREALGFEKKLYVSALGAGVVVCGWWASRFFVDTPGRWAFNLISALSIISFRKTVFQALEQRISAQPKNLLLRIISVVGPLFVLSFTLLNALYDGGVISSLASEIVLMTSMLLRIVTIALMLESYSSSEADKASAAARQDFTARLSRQCFHDLRNLFMEIESRLADHYDALLKAGQAVTAHIRAASPSAAHALEDHRDSPLAASVQFHPLLLYGNERAGVEESGTHTAALSDTAAAALNEGRGGADGARTTLTVRAPARVARRRSSSARSHRCVIDGNACAHLSALAVYQATVDALCRTHSEDIMGLVGHSVGMLQDTLDAGALNSGKLSVRSAEIVIASFFAEVLQRNELQARQRGVAVDLHIGEHVPHSVLSDHMRISAIVSNLLGNAIKFASRARQGGDEVDSTSSLGDATPVPMTPTATVGRVRVEVSVVDGLLIPSAAAAKHAAEEEGGANAAQRVVLGGSGSTPAAATSLIAVAAAPNSDSPASPQLFLRVEVIDNGPGISAGDLSRLFREYAQADMGRSFLRSSGLGLSIVRETTALLGGSILASSSTATLCTVFTITLPVQRLMQRSSGVVAEGGTNKAKGSGAAALGAIPGAGVMPAATESAQPSRTGIWGGSTASTAVAEHSSISIGASDPRLVRAGGRSPAGALGTTTTAAASLLLHTSLSFSSPEYSSSSPALSRVASLATFTEGAIIARARSDSATALETSGSNSSANSPTSAAATAAAAIAKKPRPPCYVLVVDDSALIRKFVASRLQRIVPHAIVHFAADGQGAISAVEALRNGDGSGAAAGAVYTAIIMDGSMPPGLDGYAATRAIRAGGFTGCIIGLTGDTNGLGVFEVAGADVALAKPLELAMFREVIRAAVETAAAAAMVGGGRL